MKKHLFFSLIGLIASLFWASRVYAQEKITDYQIDIRLNTDSSLEITENINYDFGPTEKHGIYRNIPAKIKNVSVNHNFTTYRENGQSVIKIGDADIWVSGIKNYIIQYTVPEAAMFFDDYDELYWNAIGTDWQIPIDKSVVRLTLPVPVDPSVSTFRCWSGPDGSTDTCQSLNLDTDQNNKVLGFEARQDNLVSGQAFTILAQIPKGILVEPKSYTWLFLFLPVLVFGLIYWFWYKEGRDPKGRGNIIVEYDVPEDLRPAEAGTIVYEKFKNSFLTAEIIYLATHGYLKITRQAKKGMFGKEDFTLEKIKPADSQLKNYQKELLEQLFVDENKKPSAGVNISELKTDFYAYFQKLQDKVWVDVQAQKYYASSGKGQRVFLIILALILGGLAIGVHLDIYFVVGFLASAVIALIFAKLMPQKTKTGILTKEYLLGLKMYLEVAEKDRLKFHNAPDKDPQQFEKLLPFAIVFGVEDQWAEKFKDIYTVEPHWYHDSTLSGFNSVLFINSLHSFETASASNLATAPSRSGAGGFGGGGGFAGGGGGGGGGGSW